MAIMFDVGESKRKVIFGGDTMKRFKFSRAVVFFFVVLSLNCRHSIRPPGFHTPWIEAKERNLGKEAIIELHKMGKDAIPILLEEMPNTKKGIWTTNPYNSFRGDLPYVAENVALVIEIILARDSFDGGPPVGESFATPENYSYLYEYGYIYKGEEHITMADIMPIHRIYIEWWEKNKHKSLEELRKDWKNGNKPLSGTPYWWS